MCACARTHAIHTRTRNTFTQAGSRVHTHTHVHARAHDNARKHHAIHARKHACIHLMSTSVCACVCVGWRASACARACMRACIRARVDTQLQHPGDKCAVRFCHRLGAFCRCVCLFFVGVFARGLSMLAGGVAAGCSCVLVLLCSCALALLPECCVVVGGRAIRGYDI